MKKLLDVPHQHCTFRRYHCWISLQKQKNIIITLFGFITMLCGTDIMHVVVPDIRHILSKRGEYPGILRGILSLPHNTLMHLNNVMIALRFLSLNS